MAHLDHAYVKNIIELLGADQFALLKDQFVLDCNRAVEALRAARAEGDEAQVKKQAHKLKGVLAQYGARQGEAIAARLADGLPSDWRDVTQALLDETAMACSEMAALVKG